ncbi:MAG: succinate dehydrogenase / fumarate reductase membrane anchor subunit [Flavobacteriales bacterium]|jgi:succinate dehydrogenase / fumarate reductase membrane anchor subunit
MVTAATSFSRNGVSDWIIQRFSAVLLMAYTVFIVGYLIYNPDVTYVEWSGLFSNICVRIFSFIVLLSIVAHGWIGLWVVLTDYATERMMGKMALPIRIIVLSAYAVINLVFLIWGAEILWGLN